MQNWGKMTLVNGDCLRDCWKEACIRFGTLVFEVVAKIVFVYIPCTIKEINHDLNA